MRGRRVWTSLIALAVTGSLAACTGGSLPPTHYYTLSPPAMATPTPDGASGLLVGVDSIAVDPPYDQDRIVYRRGRDSAEVGFYSYHRWASPLGHLLQVALADGLAGTPGIAKIEPVRSGRDYDARLGGRLLLLEEVDSAEGEEVRLAVELLLRDRAGETLWSSTIRSTSGGSAAQVDAVVDMARRAVTELLETAAAEIEAALAMSGPSLHSSPASDCADTGT